MFGLRQKISLGFGGLLLVIMMIGIQSVVHLTRLGESIDVILRENYRSVISCQQMKEAVERIDSGLLFTLLGDVGEGRDLILKNQGVFEEALQIELNTITLPGEKEKALELRDLYNRYKSALERVRDAGQPAPQRRETYFSELLPTFGKIKSVADAILQMNQQNMNDANNEARARAAQARRQMFLFLAIGAAASCLLIGFAGRWILRPVRRLTLSVEEIRRGNLDLVVPVDSSDEIGRLGEAFNAMTLSLRELRRTDQAQLLRLQKATQQAFDRIPDAVAVLDLEGRVEVSTASAKDVFGLRPEANIFDQPFGLGQLFGKALQEGRAVSPPEESQVIQEFVGGMERFYKPEAAPILDRERRPTGVILVLQDVTLLRQQDELKTGVIRTVSHQLKTPLTSIRMAIHLLLEEKIGGLNEKQAELLVAAREDSDRLHEILNNLLDISRMEAGKARLDMQIVSPPMLVMDALAPFRGAALDRGITLNARVAGPLPNVQADRSRIGHVFANLLSNALRFTGPGGTVTVAAREEEGFVKFTVSDTGAGIPAQYLNRLFEPFFRVPGAGGDQGAGLGLAIVKEIVEAHGGTVEAQSAEGQGSTFSFTLRRSAGSGS